MYIYTCHFTNSRPSAESGRLSGPDCRLLPGLIRFLAFVSVPVADPGGTNQPHHQACHRIHSKDLDKTQYHVDFAGPRSSSVIASLHVPTVLPGALSVKTKLPVSHPFSCSCTMRRLSGGRPE